MAEYAFLTDEFLKNVRAIIADEKHDKKHKLYKKAYEHAEEMEVHLYGEKPEKLLKRVRPREDPAISQYRLEAYEPTTQSTAEKALSICHKIFNPKLYVLKFDNNSRSQELKKYSLEEYPGFNSIVNYVANVLLKRTMADPNAWIVIQPFEFDILDTQRVQPIATCYESEDVHYFVPRENVLIFIDEYKDSNGNKIYLYQYFDRVGVYNVLFKRVGNDMIAEVANEYIHNFGELPCWQLGGIYDGDHPGLYRSFFSPAVPFWNKAINAESDLDGAYIMNIHHHKWEVADECDYILDGKYACNKGYIYQDTAKPSMCPSCKGTGKKSAKGPYEVYQVAKDSLNPNTGVPSPPFGFVTVPTEATAMLEKRVEMLLEKGLNALNMDVVNKIGENQSGIAKVYDRTELYDFLEKLSGLFFDVHLKNIYYYFTWYMFGIQEKDDNERTKIEPDIIKPSEFDIYSTPELTEQLKVAKESNVNPAYLQAKQEQIQNKDFASEPDKLVQLNLTLSLDPLAEIDRDSINIMQMGGTVKKTDVIIHDNIRKFVRMAMEEDKTFANKTYSEQMDVLTKYADEVEQSTKVKIDTSAIDDTGRAGQPNQ